MKKIVLLFLLPMIFLGCNGSFAVAYADSVTTDIVATDDFEEEINSQLQDLDFSSLNKIIENFSVSQGGLFGQGSFLDKLSQLLSGDFDNTQSLLQNIINVFFDTLLDLLPIISIIIAISLLGNMLQGLKPSTNGKSITNLIHFVSFGVVVILVLSIVVKMISLASNTISSIQTQMSAIFPILLTLLTTIGGTASVSAYQPAMAFLTNGIINFFSYLLLPMFIFSVVFSIMSNLSNNIKLDKFSSFFNSAFKWTTGLIFTIFSAFLTIQGITAGSIDGISIRTAKYAIRSYVPILGSYISDGMGLILTSSNLIKNSIGATGLFLLLATIIAPLLEMILFMLALKLVAGIVQPLGNKQIADFVSSLSKSMVLLIVILIGVAFAYFIMLGLVICSANLV